MPPASSPLTRSRRTSIVHIRHFDVESPDRGAVFLDGAEITRLSPGARDAAMVFQSYASIHT